MTKKVALVIALLSFVVALTIKSVQFYNPSKVQGEVKTEPSIVADRESSKQPKDNVISPSTTKKSTVVTEAEVVLETEKTHISSNQNNQNVTEFSDNLILGRLMSFFGLSSFPDERVPIIRVDQNNIGGALYLYFEKFNEYPQGSNAEIIQVLDKENLLAAYTSKKLNNKHEFLDTWGMPYEIRISPDGEFQLISAGPNKTFGDDDDKVLKEQLQ